MDVLGLSHFFTALLAMTSGAVVVLRPKGTPFHRWTGRVYFASMLAVNLTALSIYDLFNGFGPFHVAAIISLASVLMGVIVAWRRKPRKTWREAHAYWMSWSYAGLLAAAVSETATRYLALPFGWTVAGATFAVIGISAMIINRNVPRLVNPAKAANPG